MDNCVKRLSVSSLEFENNLANQQLALRQDTDARLRDDRWSGLSGALAVSASFVAVSWSIVPKPLLLGWWAINAALVIGMFCTQSGWLLNDWRDCHQAPRLLMIIYWMRGIWLGILPLLNWNAFHSPAYFWLTLAFGACFMVGHMVFNTILVAHLLIPLLITFAVLIFLNQELLIGMGLVLLLVIAIKGMNKIQQSRINEVLLRTQLKHQAYRDHLTGILNRSGLETIIATLPTAIRGALFLDLDNFKEVNDQLGHEAGDCLLQQVTERIKPIVQTFGGVFARFGGDEFFVISRQGSLSQLMDLAQQITETFKQPFSLPMGKATLSASVGITLSHKGQITLDQLYREADEAMYLSKREHQGKIIYFDDILRQRSYRRREIKTKLHNAIHQQVIVPWGQPIVDLTSGQVIAVELLARWPQVNRNPLEPAAFIPIAEELGLIEEITLLMIQYAAQYSSLWQDIPAMAGIYITVNIAPKDLTQGRLLDEVINLSRQGKINPATLTVEITEQEIIETEALARTYIEQLHQLGVRVAIDDFGTGYSSFHSIVELPIDILKLDRSLVCSIADDARMQAAVSAILRMAAQLNILTVGEGVEFEKDANILQQLGLNFAQGFLYAKPMPLHKIPASLSVPLPPAPTSASAKNFSGQVPLEECSS